jgi:hypothetical protein
LQEGVRGQRYAANRCASIDGNAFATCAKGLVPSVAFALAIFVLTTIALHCGPDSCTDGAGSDRLTTKLARRND